MLKKMAVVAFVLVFTGLPISAQQPTLRFATLEYPPYIVQAGDSAQGLTIDIVNEVFKRIGREVKYEFYPIARGLAMVADGTVDGFFTLKKNADRELVMLFPKETVVSQDYVFFVPKDSKLEFDGNFTSMANASIGVVAATSYGARFDTAAKNNEFRKLESSADYDTTFKKLLAGRMDAVICSKFVGLAVLKKMGGADKVRVSGSPVETVPSFLAFTKKKDYSDLAAAFDQTIAAMRQDGTIDRIMKKYQ